MPDCLEARRSGGVLGPLADNSGKETLFGSVVLVGLVEHAPFGNCCCYGGEPGGGGSELTDGGTVTSGIPGPGPEGGVVGGGGVATGVGW